MNFFKSVFADEEELNQSSPDSNPQQPPSPEPEPENEPTWGFVGGLIKTFATKSESVIETYRRDLQEFSTGLKMETQVFKNVASSSLEVGASRAQESLESVGQAFDSLGSVVWNSTAQIITQGNNVIDDLDLANSSSSEVGSLNAHVADSNSPVGKYSRFEAQLRGIQTFVEEPEDVEDYAKWKEGFNLEDKREEIEGLLKENGKLDAIYTKVVPNLVDHEVFWCRYYYRVYKLEQAENVRAKLVERANEDEDLSWDVDDEEEDDDKPNMEEEKKVVIDKGESMLNNNRVNEVVDKEEEIVKNVDEKGVSEVSKESDISVKKEVDEKAVSEVSKDSDISVVSSQPSSRGEEEEEDLGWDEIEDLGSEDDDEDGKKGKQSEDPSNREELRKRLNVAEDDADLSWDIEDDDEPIKKS